jgi:6-pyruvoyltetrahydropterin/6-carboxytetrahydropterin synthase
VKKIVNEKVIEKLDHHLINDVIENPSAENIAVWVWRQLEKDFPNLYEIRVWETATSSVSVRREDIGV